MRPEGRQTCPEEEKLKPNLAGDSEVPGKLRQAAEQHVDGERGLQTSVTSMSDVGVWALMVGHDRKAGPDRQELKTMILGNRIKLMQ